MIFSFREFTEQLSNRADDFFFSPTRRYPLDAVRIGTSAIAIAWLAIWLLEVGWWFGNAPWLGLEQASRIVASSHEPWESRFLFSPLWWTSNAQFVAVYLVIIALLAVMSGVGLFGRMSVLGLLTGIVLFLHRIPGATGALEPLLVAMLAYLCIDPGNMRRASSNASAEGHYGTARLAQRLIQLHVWLYLIFGFLSQAAGLVWWRGESAWWLARTGHSTLLTPELLRAQPLLNNLITHSVTIIEFLAIALIWPRWTRPVGMAAAIGVGLSYALISDQILYGMLLVVGVLSFREAPKSDDSSANQAASIS